MKTQPWYRGLSRRQWLVLTVAWLGWVFDIADTALFNFAKVPMFTELLGKERYALDGTVVEGRVLSIFLLGWSLGGLVFGLVADRWGRTRTLVVTILIYCVLTGLTGLCHTVEQVALMRFLTALGIGGEWAAGAALVAETFPDRARAPAASVLQSAAAIGPALAALAALGLAHSGWRPLFFVGVAPAALVVLVRLGLRDVEPPRVQRGPAWTPLRELFGVRRLRRHAFVALVLGVVGIAGATTVTYWVPNLVMAASVGFSPAAIQQRTSYATLILHVGTLLGVMLFPALCERFGRRRSFAAFFVFAPLSIYAVAGLSAGRFAGILALSPLMAFFAIGLSAGFALYFPELFPTRVRATGAGFAYNTGRILAAPVPPLTGEMIKRLGGNVGAGVAIAGAVYLVGLLALPFAPETRGQPLPTDEEPIG